MVPLEGGGDEAVPVELVDEEVLVEGGVDYAVPVVPVEGGVDEAVPVVPVEVGCQCRCRDFLRHSFRDISRRNKAHPRFIRITFNRFAVSTTLICFVFVPCFVLSI